MQSLHAPTLSALESSGLSSSLVPSSFEPKVFLQVEYDKGGAVELGNAIQVDAAQTEPRIGFVSDDPTKSPQDAFVLVVLDPDAPSRSDPKWSPFLHGIRTGLKPNSIDDIEKGVKAAQAAQGGHEDGGIWVKEVGEAKVEFLGPAPPEGSGPHRYVYLLYRSPESSPSVKLPASAPDSGIKEMEDRKQFPIEEFVKDNKLELVGVNFHTSEAK